MKGKIFAAFFELGNIASFEFGNIKMRFVLLY